MYTGQSGTLDSSQLNLPNITRFVCAERHYDVTFTLVNCDLGMFVFLRCDANVADGGNVCMSRPFHRKEFWIVNKAQVQGKYLCISFQTSDTRLG
jgi:hypothetical protein